MTRRGKDGVSVTADRDPPSFFLFSGERLLHAPLPAGCTSNREHTSRRSVVNSLWRKQKKKNWHCGKKKHGFTLSVCGGSGSEYETAYYSEKKLLHGRRLGNKPSRLIAGSMNFNATFTSTWVSDGANQPRMQPRNNSSLFFLVFLCFSSSLCFS